MAIGNDLAGAFAGIQQTAALLQQTNLIAQQSSIYQAEMALSMAQMEAEGLAAQLQLNQITTAVNIQADLSALATKNMLMLASKSYESALLMAQYREKVLQMFYAITEQRTNAVWGRLKQLTQGFKF